MAALGRVGPAGSRTTRAQTDKARTLLPLPPLIASGNSASVETSSTVAKRNNRNPSRNADAVRSAGEAGEKTQMHH
jgi:hypothetical protein